MKKLFLFTALLIAALFSANAFAYKVYIDDPCVEGKPSPKFWNANRVSKIGAIKGDPYPWPAWFYDAEGLIFGTPITDPVDELSIVESNAIAVAEKGKMIFSIDYSIQTLKSSNMRNFGARIRLLSSNEWDTIFTVRPTGGIFPAYTSGYDNTKEVLIGDKYNGKNVVFQIFFYNDPIATDAFIMAFTNVFLASYDDEPYVETQLSSRPLAYGDTYAAQLNGQNQSLTPITSIEYAYSINGKTEKKQTVTIADTLKSGAVAIFSLSLDITEADIDTTNKVQLWPATINGEAYTSTADDTLNFILTVLDESRLDQDYVPMLESFTSATCDPCRAFNPYLNPVLIELKNAGKLNVVKYQMNYPGSGDRYYIQGNSIRGSYYKLKGIPTIIFNGVEKPMEGEWGTLTYNGVLQELRERAEAASQNKALISIKVNKAEVKSGTTVELDFDIASHLLGMQNLDVHAMIIEGTTHDNSISYLEESFHYVNMAFATPESGDVTYFRQDEPLNFAYTVDMKNTHMEDPEDLQVVIFVQSSDGYIYQSAGVKMGKGEASSEEDEQLAQVSLRPNPASEKVYVEGLEKARVEIFDLAGRKVYERTDANDVLEVSLASFSKGVYVVRIAQNGAVASRKLVVK